MQVGQRVGPFDIEKKIGSGAMGAVYLARYRKTGQRVAIKMMLLGLSDNDVSLARFEREAEVLKQLNHKNIVRFYVASQFQGTPYYAMEFIEGEPLDLALQRKGRVTWEDVVELGKQVCAALQHAHDQGIVHRDLKPSNLMITADGTLKLTDFGIAKDLDVTQLTAANCTVGTAAYMSPEQCRGEKNLTHKSDLYSLGVVLYELLTGRKPFEAETTMDMFLMHVQGTFERPSREVLDIPVWLDTLVCQLLEKEPGKRPFDAVTVSKALDQVTEKVHAQRSAGVDVAKARIADRETVRSQSMDETDKMAARTLLTSMRRGKRKRPGIPFYEKKWFQGTGLLLALAGIAAMIYQVFRPPSADGLYRQAERLMTSKDQDDWDKARTEPIAGYLRYYGGQDDEQTRQVRRWAMDYDVALKERQLNKLRSINRDPEGEIGPLARKALDKEDTGDLAAAEERWQEAWRKAKAAREEVWECLTERRLVFLGTAREYEKRMNEAAEDVRQGKEFQPASATERRAVDALRYELFLDPDRARELWQDLKLTSFSGPDQRPWYLFAARKTAELDVKLKGRKEDELKTERQQKLKDQVDAAEKILANKPPADPKDALPKLQELQELFYLYQNDPEPKIKELAKKAGTLVQNFAPQNKPPDTISRGQGPS